MTPLGAVCAGLLLVLIDLRLQGADVAADPLGWMLVVAGVARLAALDQRFLVVRSLAVAAGLLSLVDVVRPTQTQVTSTGTSTSVAAPDGPLGLAVAGYDLLTVAVTVGLCLALRRRADEHGDTQLGRRLSLLALLQAVIGIAVAGASVAALLVAPRELESDAARAAVVVAVLAALVVGVWLLLTLGRCRHLPWLQDRDLAEDPPG